jgi:STE24 endopeptidase
MLYLFGLAVYHAQYSKQNAATQVRFILPFALPYLAFVLIEDLIQLFPNQQFFSSFDNPLGLVFVSVLFLLGALILLPPAIIWLWQGRPIENQTLCQRLENLCEKAQFKHAGMKEWGILNKNYSAAILGITSPTRFVIFTNNLLKEFPPEEIEAILAHEIGHSRYRHLWFYPFIILGMIVVAGLFGFLVDYVFFNASAPVSKPWDILYPFLVFSLYALVLALYFRFVFGFFSRLFERQADLAVFDFGIPPEHMINALDHIGVATGNTHSQPSWHHDSLESRINFLRDAIKNPELVQEHHRTVKNWLIVYFILLALGSIVVFGILYSSPSWLV